MVRMFDALFGPALTVHIGTVFVLVPLVVIADLFALLWVLGRIDRLDVRILRTLHRLVYVGIALMITSGAIMFQSYQGYLLATPAFYVKMGFVAALIINSFVVGAHLHTATTRTFAELTWAERRPLLISGAVSTVSWIGAIVAATQLGL